MRQAWFFNLFLLLLYSCHNVPENVEKILEKAGNNKIELVKVIDHYKKNNHKEKLKAVYFLIGNMENKFGRYGNIINKYFPVFYMLRDLHNQKKDVDTINKIIKLAWDSIEATSGAITGETFPYQYDYNIITANYLIENIDISYKAWKEKPWAKHLTFDQFCEYILPYRIYDEPLQPFKKKFYKEFAWLEDSLKDKSDPIEACLVLNRYLTKNFVFCSKLERCPIPGINDMYKLNAGICEHRYFLVASIMRSVGLPIGIDFTPQWNFGAGQHSWLVLMAKDNKGRPFNGGDEDMRLSKTNFLVPVSNGTATKVYRMMFAKQKNALINKVSPASVPELFQFSTLIDVTNEYKFAQTDINFELKKQPSDDIKYVFLNCFGYSHTLIPFAYSKISSTNATFKNIGLNGIYLPSYFNNNKTIIANNPYYFSANNRPVSLSPDFSKKITVKLYRKYPPQQYLYRMKDYARWMIGARFQASDNIHFKNPVTLFTIDTLYYYYVEKNIPNVKPYRYYRYISSDTGAIRIAEVGFELSGSKYIQDKTKSFRIFGETDKNDLNVKTDFKNAFDGNVATNFNAPPGSWVAIDYSKPVKIEKIGFLVRNDLNVIEIGDEYELFYFDFGWNSLGKKKAERNYLIFENVPDKSLLLLKDLTKGKDERVFIYKNNVQEWLED